MKKQGVYEAIGGLQEMHCDACFSGNYPLQVQEGGKDALSQAWE